MASLIGIANNNAVATGTIALTGTITGTIIGAGGSSANIQENKNATALTSSVEVVPDDGYDAMAKVTIAGVALQAKSVTPSNVQQVIEADSDYLGLSSVTIAAVPASKENSILTGTWSEQTYTNNEITKLAFGFPDNVTMDNVTEIGNYACYDAIGGKNYSFANCLTVGQYAFSGNTTVISVSLPKCTSIGVRAFAGCTALTTINLAKCETVGDFAFTGCQMSTYNLPECITLGSSVWRSNTYITGVSLPKCEAVGDYVFYQTTLASIELPKVKTINGSAFGQSAITSIDIGPDITSIGNSAFSRCASLASFTIRATTPPTLGSQSFLNTPIASGSGHIYVPSASVDTYKGTSGWSTYASVIEAIPSN